MDKLWLAVSAQDEDQVGLLLSNIPADVVLRQRETAFCQRLHTATAVAGRREHDDPADSLKLVQERDQHPLLEYQSGERGDNALVLAARLGHVGIVRRLLDVGADMRRINERGGAALHVAAQEGHAEIVRALLEAGSNPRWRTTTGATALFAAAQNNHPLAAEALLEAGAHPDKSGDASPLFIAAQCCSLEAIDMLVKHGADVNYMRTSDNSTSLLIAITQRHTEAVARLLAHGADPNLVNSNNTHCVHLATYQEQDKVLRLLIDAGANVDYEEPRNQSRAVHIAAHFGYMEIVKVLVEYGGADFLSGTTEGNLTPRDEAVSADQHEIVKYFDHQEYLMYMRPFVLGLGGGSEQCSITRWTRSPIFDINLVSSVFSLVCQGGADRSKFLVLS